jgi:hypothetical protein
MNAEVGEVLDVEGLESGDSDAENDFSTNFLNEEEQELDKDDHPTVLFFLI